MKTPRKILAFVLLACATAAWAEPQPEPGVAPTGADESEQNDSWGDDEGWVEDDWEEAGWADTAESPWTGFIELAAGSRWNRDAAVGRRATLGEIRWRLERNWALAGGELSFRGDFTADGVLDEVDAELRELAYGFSAGKTDFRLGRQVLTWGTGDLLFLNDLFPKGWVSFFAGRDDEYLKAPADAIRVTRYGEWFNIDLAALPRFNSDEYLTGGRLSFFSPEKGRIVAPSPPLAAAEPSASLSHAEWALRLFRNVDGNELAAYGFDGYYHQPAPVGPAGVLGFPRLRAFGASWRRTLGSGIFSTEVAHYQSRDDRAGTNSAIPNSQWRYLAAFEWEAVPRLTVGFQFYMERTLEHGAQLANSPWPQFETRKNRSWITNRLTWRTRRDRVVWSLFSFYSPADDDAYLRPQVSWRINDAWLFNAGGNIFLGDEEHRFFAQFQDNNNLYARIRYSY